MSDITLTINVDGPTLSVTREGDPTLTVSAVGAQGGTGLPAQNLKSFSIVSPSATEDIVFFFTDAELEITKVLVAVTGGGEATWNLIKSSTRSATGTNVFTIDKATTGASTIESFDEPTVSEDSYIRFSLLSFTGLITDIHLTLFYNLI